MNCEKNAVACEGYNEKTIWKSGREKAEEGMFTPCHLAKAIPSLSVLTITI